MFIAQQSKCYSTESFVYCWKWKSASVMMSHYKASLWETAANEYLFEPQNKGNVILLFVFILLTAERFSLTCLMPDVQMHLICIARVPCVFSMLTDVNSTSSFLRSHLQLMNWNSWCPLAAAACRELSLMEEWMNMQTVCGVCLTQHPADSITLREVHSCRIQDIT